MNDGRRSFTAATRSFTAAKCSVCGEVIVSKDVHDFVYCRCRSIAVDGGDIHRRYVGGWSYFEETGVAVGAPDGEVRWDE